jgi:hypothetical protein
MQKMTVPLVCAAGAALVTGNCDVDGVQSGQLLCTDSSGRQLCGGSRGDRRPSGAISLRARLHDPDLYVSTFTEDGVLDYGSGQVKGRQAIKDVIARMPAPSATPGLRAAAARHNISNIVIKVEGNKAIGRSYWFHYSNDNPQRRGVFDGFGHYEDELVKVNGKWLFTMRKIYNEGRDEWAYKGGKNPAW